MAKKRPGTRETVLKASDAKSAASPTPPPGDDAWTDRSREKYGKVIIRNRVKDLREISAGELKANARNWREHPQHQREALAGVLNEVGFADVILARELPDGGLEIIDGHLRAELADDQLVPVVILDVTEAEASKLLAVHDPIAAMATTNRQKLGDLLSDLKTKSKGLQGLFDKLKRQADVSKAVEEEDTPATKPAVKQEYTVIVIAKSAKAQESLYAELLEAGYTVKMGPQKRDPRKNAQAKG